MSSPESPLPPNPGVGERPQSSSEAILAAADTLYAATDNLLPTKYTPRINNPSSAPKEIWLSDSVAVSSGSWTPDGTTIKDDGQREIYCKFVCPDGTRQSARFTYVNGEFQKVLLSTEKPPYAHTKYQTFCALGYFVWEEAPSGNSRDPFETSTGHDSGMKPEEGIEQLCINAELLGTTDEYTGIFEKITQLGLDLYAANPTALVAPEPSKLPGSKKEVSNPILDTLAEIAVSQLRNETMNALDLLEQIQTVRNLGGKLGDLVSECLQSAKMIEQSSPYATEFGNEQKPDTAIGGDVNLEIGESIKVSAKSWIYSKNGSMMPSGQFAVQFKHPDTSTATMFAYDDLGELSTCICAECPPGGPSIPRLSIFRQEDGEFSINYDPVDNNDTKIKDAATQSTAPSPLTSKLIQDMINGLTRELAQAQSADCKLVTIVAGEKDSTGSTQEADSPIYDQLAKSLRSFYEESVKAQPDKHDTNVRATHTLSYELGQGMTVRITKFRDGPSGNNFGYRLMCSEPVYGTDNNGNLYVAEHLITEYECGAAESEGLFNQQSTPVTQTTSEQGERIHVLVTDETQFVTHTQISRTDLLNAQTIINAALSRGIAPKDNSK